MIDPSDVTLIIPHLGADEQQEYAFTECYASLLQTAPKGMRILVVKNGNKACPHIRDIRVVEQGQCKAVNAGVAITDTPWIMVSNDDMIYAPGWFDKLVDSMNEDIQCISPQLVEPRQGAPTFETFFAGGAGGDFDKDAWLEYEASQSGGEIRTGFNLPFLMTRELWDTVGGYNINFDPWGSNSDSDLEYKIKLAGVQPHQNTSCKIYHFSQTSGTFNPAHQDAWHRNFAYFREKWGFDRTDQGIWEANFIIPSVEQGRVFTPDWEGKYV